jgi:hypothetical protein
MSGILMTLFTRTVVTVDPILASISAAPSGQLPLGS